VGNSSGTGVFRGRHYLSIDAKGRVNVPAPFREVLVNRFGEARLMLATVFDPCLRAYPLEEWEQIEVAASAMQSTNTAVKQYFRHFISSAEECACDKQGRILLPPSHREWAGMNGSGQVVLLGLVNKIEIWEKTAYEARMREADLGSVEEAITQLGGQI